MATIRRGTIVQDMINALKLQVGADSPNQTSEKMLLTFDYSNAKVTNICKSNTRTSSGSATVYTTPSDEDFFLTSATLSVVKDATCDDATGATASIACIIGGGSQTLMAISGLVTTATAQTLSLEFNPPIKVDRASNISVSGNTYTAGLKSRSASITGYTTSG